MKYEREREWEKRVRESIVSCQFDDWFHYFRQLRSYFWENQVMRYTWNNAQHIQNFSKTTQQKKKINRDNTKKKRSRRWDETFFFYCCFRFNSPVQLVGSWLAASRSHIRRGKSNKINSMCSTHFGQTLLFRSVQE